MKEKVFRMGRDRITGEYVNIEEAHRNLDRYEVIALNTDVKKLRDSIYEPEHKKGGVCWCGIIYEKREDGKMHISHKSQRDLITDFARK